MKIVIEIDDKTGLEFRNMISIMARQLDFEIQMPEPCECIYCKDCGVNFFDHHSYRDHLKDDKCEELNEDI